MSEETICPNIDLYRDLRNIGVLAGRESYRVGHKDFQGLLTPRRHDTHGCPLGEVQVSDIFSCKSHSINRKNKQAGCFHACSSINVLIGSLSKPLRQLPEVNFSKNETLRISVRYVQLPESGGFAAVVTKLGLFRFSFFYGRLSILRVPTESISFEVNFSRKFSYM